MWVLWLCGRYGLPQLLALRLACAALTGKLTGLIPASVSWTPRAGTASCVLNEPGACEPSSTLASRSLGVIAIGACPFRLSHGSGSKAIGRPVAIYQNEGLLRAYAALCHTLDTFGRESHVGTR